MCYEHACSATFAGRRGRISISLAATAAAVMLLAACERNTDQQNNDLEPVSAINMRVETLLSSLTLEQKVAQMIQGEIKYVTPEDVRRYGLGSVLNGGGSFPGGDKHATLSDWTALADAYYEASVNTSGGGAGIPIIWGTDAVHGHNNVIGATLFPHNIGLGAANDPELVGAIARATAREVKATGIDWIFAPTIAVAKDPRWGRTYESFSSEPERVAQFAAPIVEAMQAEHIVATAKHFIGDGGTYQGDDQGDTRLSLDELLLEHGQGYFKALAAGAKTVMASFNSWNGEKIHGNKELLTDVLKDSMAFDGFVVSDWNGIGQVANCSDSDCAQAINAGIDMLMAPEDWEELMFTTIQQVRDGIISEARIDDAVRRILTVKADIGLLDRHKPSETAAPYRNSVGSSEHRALARDAVRRSLVLLKNANGLLPLRPKGRYLVTGPGADDIGMQSGGWTISWQGTGNVADDFPGATSIIDGLRKQIERAGGEVVTDPNATGLDAIVYVFGETPYAEGVGDIESLAWQQRSKQDLAAIKSFKESGSPVVSLFITGRPRWINGELNASDALVVGWLPGSEGEGVADVLLRDANNKVQYDFIGRLPMAWPNADINRMDPNLPVSDVLFPVGYGLSSIDTWEPEVYSEAAVGVLKNEPELMFSGGERAPWLFYLGDAKDPALAAGPGDARSAGGFLSVAVTDRAVQEDTRRLSWLAAPESASIYFGRGSAWDASGLAAAGGELSFTWRLLQGDPSNLRVFVNCGANCEVAISANQLLRGDPVTWQESRIPLNCLQRAGLDVTAIYSPFGLRASENLIAELWDVRVTDGASTETSLSCDQFVVTSSR